MSVKTWAYSSLLLALFSQGVMAKDVTVFAAASLTNALNEISADYKKESGMNTVMSYASSSTLARQIAQGAPADIYLSANEKWMDYVADQGAIDKNSRIDLLKNALVLVAPSNYPENKITITSSFDLTKALDGTRLAVGDPAHVPAGRYAKQSLENLGLWKQAEPLLARANNVRGALALVERGEAKLGIVYQTDADITNKVKVVADFPADSHKPITYPIAIVKGQEDNKDVVSFYDYLRGQQAKSVFTKYGFTIVK
ncbi:molybdate ABC transporter substrate-binding protein [Photobacterium damselae]|uniref:molybdate ABC transporter substrate-binding protein n=1 Tax=Photobacterium damselae TaxID=38293 RepID=UPI000AE71BAA|nr:molybdate ABC transporter substrate-binding protein [Photobacterium damselae]MCG3813017.1 molybdate ABC transporter substrate-binding protein [Photobacterium damselae]NVO59579.1 molybdate ABC transporter substrate-binding protein [Photobacterium damselae subsp. damselae]